MYQLALIPNIPILFKNYSSPLQVRDMFATGSRSVRDIFAPTRIYREYIMNLFQRDHVIVNNQPWSLQGVKRIELHVELQFH
jgi:hypothetical protein